jgi:hypothetical protein
LQWKRFSIIVTTPPSILSALALTNASAIFWCADLMIFPKVWRETFILSAAASW